MVNQWSILINEENEFACFLFLRLLIESECSKCTLCVNLKKINEVNILSSDRKSILTQIEFQKFLPKVHDTEEELPYCKFFFSYYHPIIDTVYRWLNKNIFFNEDSTLEGCAEP